MRLVVDVQPFGPTGAGGVGCHPYELGGDAAAPKIRVHRRIEQKSVDAAVPGDIDEADQPVVDGGGGVAEAAAQDSA
jgi:hypothetical protein